MHTHDIIYELIKKLMPEWMGKSQGTPKVNTY